MPIDPRARERLIEAIEERRLDLGMTLKEFCDGAGISYETLRNFRGGDGGLRSLTQRKLDKALAWQPGDVARVLAGKPAAAPAEDRPSLVRDNWDDEPVRVIWRQAAIPARARLGLIVTYLAERDSARDQTADPDPGSRNTLPPDAEAHAS